MSSPKRWLYFIYGLLSIINGDNSNTINATINNKSTVTFPIPNNCTEHVLPMFNRIRKSIKTITNVSIHRNRPSRAIDPFCLVPDITFNYTFMPDFYCHSMVKDLYCNKSEELQFLQEFYQLLDGDNWFNNKHWLDPNVDYCKWYGIYCCNTSYPLYNTCINIIYLTNNNLFGTLPSQWMNSSVLTVFAVSENHISGTIPDYHERLPNLSLFALSPKCDGDPDTDSIVGPLPNWPSAGCMINFYVGCNKHLDKAIPDWNKLLKYMAEIGMSSTSFSGTLPQWTEWKWPYQITIASAISPIFGNLSGSISPFTNAQCPTLEKLLLTNLNLEGTMPPLPPQFINDPGNTVHVSLKLSGNKLNGEFPWDSLSTVSYLQINDNQFSGNIKLPFKYKHFAAINISNNAFTGMFPCLMHNDKLQFVDARFNNFDSIATDKDDECIVWPKTLKQLLLSNNKINSVLDIAIRNLTNMSIMDFGNNRFKGTVPPSLVEGTVDAIYISFYDNDISCIFPDNDRVFSNGSWLYIGNRMQKPFSSYTNKYELSLGIVSIVPDNELVQYLVIPLIIGVICFVLYMMGLHFVNFDAHNNNHSIKQKILYIMKQTLLFIGSLVCVGMIMIVVYTKGSNFYKCGYKSLQWSITYLSDSRGTGYDVYSYISIALFLIYSAICTFFVARLCYLANYFINKHPANDEPLQVRLLQSVNEPLNNDINASKCYMWSWLKTLFYLIVLVVLLFGPMIAYSIYHSIPYSHIKHIPNLTSPLSQNLVIYVFPFLLSIAKFFGIPYAINKIQSRRNCRNTLIYIVRFITLILIPIIILLIFDDGCFQFWKYLWDYCDKDKNDNYINPQCSVIPSIYTEYVFGTYVCHSVCYQNVVPYRCSRRLFEVLGPLYMYKMSIAFWFPLLYFFRKTKLRSCLKRMKLCKNDDANIQTAELEFEYMSLVSSLEIIIVFGWALPVLVVLYGITMFGYWCVYSYWFDHMLQFVNHDTLKPALHWLILSLILQHILAITFYWFTQSMTHGLICSVIAFINLCIFLYLMHWFNSGQYQSKEDTFNYDDNRSSLLPANGNQSNQEELTDETDENVLCNDIEQLSNGISNVSLSTQKLLKAAESWTKQEQFNKDMILSYGDLHPHGGNNQYPASSNQSNDAERDEEKKSEDDNGSNNNNFNNNQNGKENDNNRRNNKNKKSGNHNKYDCNVPGHAPLIKDLEKEIQRLSTTKAMHHISPNASESNESSESICSHPHHIKVNDSIWISVSKKLTTKEIPMRVNETYSDVMKQYMKQYILTHENSVKEIKVKQNTIQVVDFNFHCKTTHESLYVICENTIQTKHNDVLWKTNNKLFTVRDIQNLYNISSQHLPKASLNESLFSQIQRAQNEIKQILNDIEKRDDLIEWKKRPWNRRDKIEIYNKSKRCGMSLVLTKQQFVDSYKKYKNSDDKVRLVPIIAFRNNEYIVENVHIIQIGKDIQIGISIEINVQHRHRMKATGIYLDIGDQHKLAHMDSDCHCLSTFHCSIDRLEIGETLQERVNQSNISKYQRQRKEDSEAMEKVIKHGKQLLIDAQNTQKWTQSLLETHLESLLVQQQLQQSQMQMQQQVSHIISHTNAFRRNKKYSNT